LDVGAEVENYAADITRTYFLKKPTKRQQAIYDAVAEVAAFARDHLKPGVTIRENEKAVEEFMGEKLRELGLIKSITHDNVRKYYTHACSHYLGLDAHDAGDYDAPLEPGMVITVEPGIYTPEENFGVRIEGDVLITETGLEILSKAAPYA
jgi:Xaa-Pro aminopeptidase